MDWNTKYALEIILDKSNKTEEYIKKLNNNDEKNIETKINLLEKDYRDKLDEYKLLCNNSEEINNIKNKNSLIILQKELEIIKLLTKYTLQNKHLDYNFFTACLNILLDLSETLRIRIEQKEIIHDKTDYDNISRCSYKFCSFRDGCSYNYNTKVKNLCYQDHYVHNMVSADLKILLNYINYKHENNLISHNKEILKTINTLSFVIGHMELELRTKCLYLSENEWELNHFVKNK